MNKAKFDKLYEKELRRSQFTEMPSEEKWKSLERLHILSQYFMAKHYQAHFLMMVQAYHDKRPLWVMGQIFRFLLVGPAHLLGWLPEGNVGTSRAHPFKKMPLPKDIEEIIKG